MFEAFAQHILTSETSLVYRWDLITPTKRRLIFPKQCEAGFELRAQAEKYGLYAFAEGWHSAAWDANTPNWSFAEMTTDFFGFLWTLLSADARLDIHLAGGRPHKWVLHYIDEKGPQSETTALLFFRYWGVREVISRQNTTMPSRYSTV